MSSELFRVLDTLPDASWERPAIGGWTVRDVAAHLLDTAIRRLSFQRDGLPLPPNDASIDGFASLTAMLDGLNRDWVVAARRVSPRVMLDLLHLVDPQLTSFLESLDLEAPAFFPVAWAGPRESPAWLDVGREYTERWHHQQQIRAAVAAPLLTGPEWLSPVLRVAVHAIPRAYAALAPVGPLEVALHVSGPAGGDWTLAAVDGSWSIAERRAAAPAARVFMDEDTAWRLLHKAMPPADAAPRVRTDGDPALTAPMLRALALMA